MNTPPSKIERGLDDPDGYSVQPLLDRLVEQTVFTPIRHGSAVAETVGRIGQAIAVGLLRPGEQLPAETRLAETLGISPVTLRGALAILREGGLLETRRGRGGGTFVSDRLASRQRFMRDRDLPSESEARSLVEYRCILEAGGAALAAERATPGHLDQMAALITKMDKEISFHKWTESDTFFHLALADATGLKRLVSEITDLRVQAQAISLRYEPVPVSTMRLSNQEHREILRALRARKPDAARTAMVRHIESTLALWLGLGMVQRRADEPTPRRAGRLRKLD